MEEKLLKIINHYGVNHQQRKLNEEAFELQEAIIEKEYYSTYFDVDNEGITIAEREGLTKHIAEEIADIEVMLLQFKEYYEIDGNDILKIMNEKIDRQIERIKNENIKQ